MLIVSAALLLANASPAVGIDLDPLGDGDLPPAAIGDLYGRLVVRLLDAGYSVRTARHSPLLLTIDRVGERFEITATTDQRSRSFRTQAAPLTVELLEVQHRALEAVQGVSQGVANDTDAIDITVEFDASIDAAQAERMYGEIVDVLVAGDLVVVPPGEISDWRVCVGLDDAGEVLSYTVPAGAICDGSVEASRGRSGLESHVLEIWAANGEGSDVEAEAESTQEPVTVPVAPAPRRALLLGLGAGPSVRGRHVDGLVWLGLRAHGRHGFGAAVAGQLIPSSGPDLTLLDIYALGGPAWANQIGRRGEVSVSLLAGVQLHGSRFQGDALPVRDYFTTQLDVGVGWHLADRFLLELVLSPGASSQAQRHVFVDDEAREVAWQRSAVRVGATMRFHYVWGRHE